jgi:hypothetical protein
MKDRLTQIIKQQAELFLLDSGEFFPFGSSIDADNQITPIGAYIEDKNDKPASLDVINLLEKDIRDEIESGRYILAAIAVDVLLRENGKSFDALQIRFFEIGKEYTETFKYIIEKGRVRFLPLLPQV